MLLYLCNIQLIYISLLAVLLQKQYVLFILSDQTFFIIKHFYFNLALVVSVRNHFITDVSDSLTFKGEVQTAIFKTPLRTAQ